MSQIKSEQEALYKVGNLLRSDGTVPARSKEAEDALIEEAMRILKSRISRGIKLEDPEVAANYLQFKMAEMEKEVFYMLTLDNNHRVISLHQMFTGTLASANIYSREVVKQALADNAAAVMFAHNHPSGNPEISEADKRITERLVKALELIDVRVLDHFVIGDEVTSFAKTGLL